MSLLTFFLGFGHYITAAALAAAALAALNYLPGKVGGIGGMLLMSAAAGVICFQLGFQERGKTDQTIQLQAQLAEANREADEQKKIAKVANEREQLALKDHDNDQKKISDYIIALAKANSDIALSRNELGELRALVDHHQTRLARAATAVRATRAASVGCKALVAQYIGALNDANRRLENDQLFYDDVREGYSR